MISDARAREILFAVQPGMSIPKRQAIQAIGRFEGNYGAAFGGANNWGAVQCGHVAPCREGCVQTPDTHADGTQYQGCFRAYPDLEAGAADLVRLLDIHFAVPADVLNGGNADAIASGMRNPPKASPSHGFGYFEAPIDRYAKAIASNAGAIATNLGEPLYVLREADLAQQPALPGEGGGGTLTTLGAIAALALLGGFIG